MKKSERLMNVACATLENNTLVDIHRFTGNDKDILEFMNKENCKRLLSSNFSAKVVFNLCFVDEDELNDITNWFTVDELELSGILKTEEE